MKTVMDLPPWARPTRPTAEQYYLRMAALAATRGTCLRRKVGCVLVDSRGHVLATGRNGVATGLEHCDEPRYTKCWTGPRRQQELDRLLSQGVAAEAYDPGEPGDDYPPMVRFYPHACPGARAPSGTQLDACGAIHAEQNALLQCQDVFKIHVCYVTASPCVTCVKLLMNTSCRDIIYGEKYAHDEPAMKLWLGSFYRMPSGQTWNRTWRQGAR